MNYPLASRHPAPFRSTPVSVRSLLCLLTGAAAVALLASCASMSFSDNSDARATALLAQMTLDEKIGQMVQVDSDALPDKTAVQKYFLGSVLSGGNSDPTNGDNSAQAWLKFVTDFESQSLQTRLKIPLLYGIDTVHGHNNVVGAVIFPHNIGIGATHNAALAEAEEHVTAEEMLGTGIHWGFGPCVAVAQNERWGRTYESYSSSPELVAELGAAAVRGFQGPDLSGPESVLACAKHFLGDGGTVNGKDQGDVQCDEATFRKLYLPPYVSAVKAGVGSIMVSYSSWNGLKMSANKQFMTDVLKGELGFQGFLISDWAAIDQISPDYKHDIEVSVNAGMDMFMIPNAAPKANNYVEFIQDLKDLVATGAVPMSRIDDAARRILRVKFAMGLFDKSADVDPRLTAAIGSPEHREVARECVSESLVLLKNDKNALPLSKTIKHLHVVGAAADDIGIQCGGWTISWQGKAGNVTTGGTTILEAIKAAVSPGTQVTYSADGTGGQGADAVLVVMSEKPYAEGMGDAVDLTFHQAAPRTRGQQAPAGQADTASAADLQVLANAKQSGAPIITVLLSGRPLVLGNALDTSDAFVAAWLPGTEGEGVTDVLFGDKKFTGRLPRAWPRDNTQLDSLTLTNPLFPMGYGL